MKKYLKYKDSGVEWIGEVPEGWEVKRLKYLCHIVTGEKDTNENEEDGQYPFFVRSQSVERISTYSFDGEAVLTAGDGVGVGKVFHYFNGKFDFHQRVYKISNFKQVAGRYFFYYIRENFHKEVMKISAKSTVDSLRLYMIQNFPVAFGNEKEQKEIAAYLDRKTAQIDQTISEKEKLIELFREERQAIINHAVTKGIRPGMKMKDSGVAWIGEVPEGWEVKKLKYVLDSLNSKRIPLSSEVRGEMVNKEYDYYGASGVIDKVEDFLFDETLILVGEDGANLLSRSTSLAFLAKGKYWVNNHAHILKPKNGSLEYFVHQLELNDFTVFVTGSAQPKLTQENLFNIFLICPPFEEQNLIVEFISNKTTQIDAAIHGIQQEIALLQEYRQALIFEAVTGKIDVRDTI